MTITNAVELNPRNFSSHDEIKFFKRNGYVVKRRILDPNLMHQAIERCWKELPSRFERNDPDTWKGVVTDSCMTCSMIERRGVVKLRDSLTWEDSILDMYPRNPIV